MLQRARWAASGICGCSTPSAPDESSMRSPRRHIETPKGMPNGPSRKRAWESRRTRWSRTRLSSRGSWNFGDSDFVSARIDADARILEIPRPAGVVLALTPSTNPIATVFFKVLLSLMTRNAMVVSPHPLARECCVDAAHTLARAAARQRARRTAAIQVVEGADHPADRGADEQSATTDVIVATGGTAVVRAAYRSGNPALGVGPGNVPVLVDAHRRHPRGGAAAGGSRRASTTPFCARTNRCSSSRAAPSRCSRELATAGGHICAPEETRPSGEQLFPAGRFNIEALGKDAQRLPGCGDRVRAGRPVCSSRRST